MNSHCIRYNSLNVMIYEISSVTWNSLTKPIQPPMRALMITRCINSMTIYMETHLYKTWALKHQNRMHDHFELVKDFCAL